MIQVCLIAWASLKVRSIKGVTQDEELTNRKILNFAER